MAPKTEPTTFNLLNLQFGEILLPVGVIGLLMLMLLPLPPLALDLFLSFSMTISILILLVTMHAQRPVDFSVFPTVLLLLTLFRLALNIASTRVILLHGHEGPGAAGYVGPLRVEHFSLS